MAFMLTAETFLASVEDYLSRSPISATAFGLAVCGDPNFVHDMRQGRIPNLRLVEKVNAYIEAHPAPAEAQQAAS